MGVLASVLVLAFAGYSSCVREILEILAWLVIGLACGVKPWGFR